MMYTPLTYDKKKTSFTKTFLKDGSKKSYGNADTMRMKDIDIDTIDDLKEVMDLCNEVDGCLTGGQPIRNNDKLKARVMKVGGKRKPTMKEDAEFSVLVIDSKT